MAIGRKVSPAKFIGMAIMGGIAVARMIKARKAKKRALAEQKKAQAEMEKRKKEFEAQDTSNIYADVRNPYENISTENVYEDLTSLFNNHSFSCFFTYLANRKRSRSKNIVVSLIGMLDICTVPASVITFEPPSKNNV